MGSAVITSSLTRAFGNLTAVDNLDLTIEKGEIFGRFLVSAGAPSRTE
jgi:ABC-2 type transport system ATP-binding protein